MLEIVLRISRRHILEAAVVAHYWADGFRRHAHRCHHLPFIIQHPLHRQVTFHHQPARIRFQFLCIVQLQTAYEFAPCLLYPRTRVGLQQHQSAAGHVARHPVMDALYPPVFAIHTPDIQHH